MGFLSMDSTSQATDNRIVSSGQGRTNRGNKNVSLEGKNAKNVGEKGKLLEQGSTDLSNAKVNTGIQNSKFTTTSNRNINLKGNQGSVTIGDSQGMSDLTAQFLDTISKVSGDNSSAVQALATGSLPPPPVVVNVPPSDSSGGPSATDLASQVTDSLKQAGVTAPGSGAASMSHRINWWWVGIGGLALAALIYFFTKKP